MVFASHLPLSWPNSFCFVAARKAVSVILLPPSLLSLRWHGSLHPAFTLPTAEWQQPDEPWVLMGFWGVVFTH